MHFSLLIKKESIANKQRESKMSFLNVKSILSTYIFKGENPIVTLVDRNEEEKIAYNKTTPRSL